MMPLIITALLFPLNLLSYAAAMHVVVQIAARLIQTHQTVLGFWRSTLIMGRVTLIMAAAHLTQITIWAVALLPCLHLQTFETAFYLSAQDYTSLGYGDIRLIPQWRLLGPLEAMNGLLFFGLSTSVMFGALSRLMDNRLRAQSNFHAERGQREAPSALPTANSHLQRELLSIRALVRPGERI